MFALIFWISVGVIIYTYIGYPLLLLVSIFFRRVRPIGKADITPTVSMIITAYNEEKNIGQKIENALSLDYPKDKLEIIVASDCSTDKTDEIVLNYKDHGVILLRQPERGGKTAAQNTAVLHAKGEILLFSDATSVYETDAIRKIVRSFADPSVACVGGRYYYVEANSSSAAKGCSLYWKYETFLKKRETLVNSPTGVSGCIYAVRKESFKPIDPELISDFVTALQTVEQGRRVVYEPEAVCFEETTESTKEEFRMRIRIIIRALNALFKMRKMMNPIKYGLFALDLLSHKLLRFAVPLFLFAAFVANIVVLPKHDFYVLALLAQVFLYSSAFIGFVLQRRNIKKLPFYVPFYFCMMNFAAVIAMYKYIRGERMVTWKPSR